MLQREEREKKIKERGVIVVEGFEAEDVVIATEREEEGPSNNDKINNKEGREEERGVGGVAIIGNRKKEVLDVSIL